MTVHLHEEDIPADLFSPGAAIAVDTETMGLITPRDPCAADLDDRQLADIGLTRADVERRDVDPASQARAEALRHHGRWRV